ncbi:MAG: MBL fold metallo-hydrolase [Lentisphaeria bacterium]|nr:MBL fold metallo-hydrolase [Lentisphaeria bacterium]
MIQNTLAAMRLILLGTGAADYDWSRFGEPGVRGSTSSLLNGHILIDCGATGLANLRKSGIRSESVDTLLFTHSHDDHFRPDQAAELAQGRSRPLRVFAAPEVLALLPEEGFEKHALSPGLHFSLGELNVTALPANHMTHIPSEQAYHYLFESAAGTLLYALDGAGLTKPEWLLIDGVKLDWIVIDCTMAEEGNWRIFEHNDRTTVRHILATFRSRGMIGEGTRVVLNHLARTLWPEDAEEIRKKAAEIGAEAAYDGMLLERESRF